VHELFSFGDIDVPNRMGQLHGFCGCQLVLTGIDLPGD
jgi:hypothetical protein